MTLEVTDKDKNVKIKERIECADKVQGKQQLSIAVLRKLHDPNKKWLDLVDETKKMVLEEREQRGAMDQPKKNTVAYYQE
jgi:hypothetical protein